jgi:hypothetical protein
MMAFQARPILRSDPFPGLAATYPPPPVAQDAVLDVTNMGTADGVSPWSNIRRHVPAVPLSSRTKS